MEHYLAQLEKDMELRGFSGNSKDYYFRHVEAFLKHWVKSPETATENDLRDYLYHMLTALKRNPSTVNQCNTALRFFYQVTLNRTLNLRAIPRFNTGFRLPATLTQDEVGRIISACENLKHKAVLMTLYGSGIRLHELINLKVGDIDSANMRLFINQGKGKRDRYALLSKANVHILREYYRSYRPKEWLFEGRKAGDQYTTRSVQCLVSQYAKAAGIEKKVSPHAFRHSFATHLLENGYDILQIKQLMGHSSMASTMVYLHLSNTEFQKITAPLDVVMGCESND